VLPHVQQAAVEQYRWLTLLSALDVFAALLCIMELVALVRFKANVVFVILGCAIAGLLCTLSTQ
jgi:hypothetical protein